MTVSNLTDVCIWSPNCYAPRAYAVQKVTVHHMAGDLTVEQCGAIFASPSRQASSNYGVGSDGRIACYVDEDNAAWTSSSWWNDNQAITIEVADYDCVNWIPSDAAYWATVDLCADICTRYGITPTYTGDSSSTFTEHLMFAATGCPGPWWHDHMHEFVNDVTNAMGGLMRPADVWEYSYKNTAPGGNMYNCAVSTYEAVAELAKKVDALAAKVDKISTGGVDAKAIAKAVNDDAAARMKA